MREHVTDIFIGYAGVDTEKLDESILEKTKQEALLLKWVAASWSRFAGTIDLKGIVVNGIVDCSNCAIDGNLVVDFGRIDGSFKIDGTTSRDAVIKGNLTLMRSQVHHDITIGPCTTIEGGINLDAIVVEGKLRFKNVKVGALKLPDNGIIPHSVLLNFGRVGGSFILSDTELAGELQLNRCQIRHNVEIGRESEQNVAMAGTTAGLNNEKGIYSSIGGRAVLTALNVGGKLFFTGAYFAHGLDLTDASLTQGLCTGHGLKIQCCLKLDSLRSQEDVDLTGLSLTEKACLDCQTTTWPDEYRVSAANLDVTGTLRLSFKRPEPSSPHSRIPGHVNLSRAKLRQLELHDELLATTSLLTLEDAQIGTLKLHEQSQRDMRLRGLTVQEWDFGSNSDNVWQQYHDFLRKPKMHDSKTLYHAIEQRLYDEGDDINSDL